MGGDVTYLRSLVVFYSSSIIIKHKPALLPGFVAVCNGKSHAIYKNLKYSNVNLVNTGWKKEIFESRNIMTEILIFSIIH